MIRTIALAPANDMHVHFRQDDEVMLTGVINHTSKRCGRALVMPNTKIPVTTAEDVVRDYKKIKKYSGYMEPLMTIKIDANSTPEKVKTAKLAGAIAGKIYPEGVTTNSEGGISREMFNNPSRKFLDTLGEMERCGMVLCLHGEMPGYESLDREQKFLFWVNWVTSAYSKLKVVLEHITTEDAAYEVMMNTSGNLAATITVHHLVLTLDDVIGDKLNPHAFCKPIAKRIKDREVLIRCATSGNPNFFLGTDSAPHFREKKECAEGCAGVYTAPLMTEILVDIFDKYDALDRLDGFMTRNAEWFYNLTPVEGTVLVEKERWLVPDNFNNVVPLYAGKYVDWQVR